MIEIEDGKFKAKWSAPQNEQEKLATAISNGPFDIDDAKIHALANELLQDDTTDISGLAEFFMEVLEVEETVEGMAVYQ